MAVNRSQANAQMLQQTMDVQNKTEESIFRMQRQAIETEEIAAVTLEELRKQGQQMVSMALVILLIIVTFDLILRWCVVYDGFRMKSLQI